MKPATTPSPKTRRLLSLALFVTATCFVGALFSGATSPRATAQQPAASIGDLPAEAEALGLTAFRQAAGDAVTAVVIELKGEPGVMRKAAAEQLGQALSLDDLAAHARSLVAEQAAFRASLASRGVRALMRENDSRQVDGSVRRVKYQFTYLLNGFVAYVADADLERLRALPEVAHVSVAESPTYFLDKAIDYSLGTQTNPADRRTAVYGAIKEFEPVSELGHPEAPRTTKIDGFEGHNMNIAVIDSGVDWRHPMFGGIGELTPLPRVSGQPETAADNKKVIYYYALSSPGDPTDDFGHGTLVASCAAGFSVDGNTTPRTGYGLGRDGTGIGPTLNGAQLFGTAPQAKIMGYKVCGPAPQCPGDIPLAIEDAASPFTLVESGTPTAVSKPIADVINLSLGDTSGDPAGATARAANNAALAGTIVVASAGNSGPGAGTIGSPSAATLAISVAASLDPGSISAADLLAPNQIPGETRAPTAGPPPETGAASNANAPQPNERQGIKIFPVAGGGPIPDGSLSAHYVFVDRRATPPAAVPASATNRIAVVKGSGTFASIANPVALAKPAAILIVTTVESATAVVVVNGIPTFTINPTDAEYLLDQMVTGDAGDNNPNVDPPNGTVSELPLRLAESFSLESYQPSMAGFSSRGPNDHGNARFRTIKPDVTAPGVGIVGAATAEGLPDETVGLASHTGYTQANGTSFSGPITAGAMAVVRQYVRETLGLDETDSATDRAKANWRARRFDSVTVARALLQNSATNLRSGLGVPQGDGSASTASINDMGAGHINVAGALQGKAIMVAPTDLLLTPAEYSAEFAPSPTPAASPGASPKPLSVLIPTVSFGPVPVVNVNGIVVRTREVIIRDVANGAGSGVYNLTVQNNRSADNPGFQISFLSADGTTPITSVSVPANGQTSFLVQVAADGTQIAADPTEFQWYVTATSPTAQTLRMPFYYRAVRATIPNITSPVQTAPTGTETPSPTPTPSPSPSASPTPTPPAGCATDTNGDYTVNWTYTKPSTGPSPVGFRIQEATRSEQLFFDNADELLVAGANSKWSGSAQWNSNVNPSTGSRAYYVPDAANQNESLTMINAVKLPSGGATLSFDTTQMTEQDFDFAHVELSADGVNYVTLASFSGSFTGTRFVDISAYAGQSIKVRFRMSSDLVVSEPGWWVENIRINSDDFRTLADVSGATTSLDITGRFNGSYFYRIAGLFTNPIANEPIVTGTYSNVRCVNVVGNPLPPPNFGTIQFASATYAVGENEGNATITVAREDGSAGTVTVKYATSDGSAVTGEDYTASTGTLTFGPGEQTKTFTVPIIDDGNPEPEETVNLTLSDPTGGASLGSRTTAVLTIIDDQGPPVPGTLQFSASDYSESESAGNVTVTVTRTGGTDGTITVGYATSDGSAKANSDYTPTSGTLSFGPGEVTKTFTVALVDDPSAEPDEAFIVTLSNPTGGATLGSRSSATVTILDTDRSGPPAQLLNISTRLRVQGGERVGIGGFIVTGSGVKRIIVRGIGPSLAVNGTPVEGRLQDPVLELYNSDGIMIAQNDNWKESPERSEIEGSGLAPSNDAEAAIARTVSPGAYTAIVYGKGDSEGIALVEAYDRDQGGTSEMANISTRGFVSTGDNVLIGGFIAGARSGATNVIVRAIGPSLANKGVTGALQNPIVELYNADGDVVDSNDDWKSSGEQAEITARGLAPQDDRESAAIETVAPGNYTVIVRGKNETTGVGLVEIYNVQ